MTSTHLLVDHLFRQRAGQLVAWLTRVFGPAHIDLAEEVVQDALVKALQQWPFTGIPENPAGWLFQVARNGALDVLRRSAVFRERSPQLAAELTRWAGGEAPDDRGVSALKDDELRMIFLCCHPSLAPESRVALALKTVGGFSVQEIGRAFLTTEATIAQRLVRAKRVLRKVHEGFALPSAQDLAGRLESVLEVVYLMFNEGYTAPNGDDLIRVDVCRESLRLARAIAGAPEITTPSAHALAALIAFQSARLASRIDTGGEVVLLEAQDRTLWDQRLIAMGFHHLGLSAEGPAVSRYHMEAAIAAAHAQAARPEDTDWRLILRLYDDLQTINPSPLVALNRAVAVWKVHGVAEAMSALACIEGQPVLAQYYLLPALQGRLREAAGDIGGARTAYARAVDLPCSDPERRLLRTRLISMLNAEC